MNHFGIAFGAITATVIGGALLLNHNLKDKTVAMPAPHTQPAIVADATRPDATTSAPNVADTPAVKLNSKG